MLDHNNAQKTRSFGDPEGPRNRKKEKGLTV